MNKDEAKSFLALEIQNLRKRSYRDLRSAVDEHVTRQMRGGQGTIALWDSEPDGDIRVIVTIDDGGVRALMPLSEDFIVAPDGSFAGE